MDKKTYSLMEDYMLSCMNDSAHDKEHIYRVLYNALEIARSVSGEECGQMQADEQEAAEAVEPSPAVNYDVLIAACLLHDIGRDEQYKDPCVCHAMVGGEKAYRFLVEQGFDASYAEQVKQCIQTHRYRKGNTPRSMEAKILFDADKLDASGALGIARTLMYKGIVGEPLYTVMPDGEVSDGENDSEPSFFQEYKYKLENIYSNFYTKKGKEIAHKRREAAVRFYEGLFDEVSGSYKEGKEELYRITGV